jgi:hypothetical protein
MIAHGVSRGFRASGRSSPGGAQDSKGDSVCTRVTGKPRRETYKPLQTGCSAGRKASESILRSCPRTTSQWSSAEAGWFYQDPASVASLVQPGA